MSEPQLPKCNGLGSLRRLSGDSSSLDIGDDISYEFDRDAAADIADGPLPSTAGSPLPIPGDDYAPQQPRYSSPETVISGGPYGYGNASCRINHRDEGDLLPTLRAPAIAASTIQETTNVEHGRATRPHSGTTTTAAGGAAAGGAAAGAAAAMKTIDDYNRQVKKTALVIGALGVFLLLLSGVLVVLALGAGVGYSNSRDLADESSVLTRIVHTSPLDTRFVPINLT